MLVYVLGVALGCLNHVILFNKIFHVLPNYDHQLSTLTTAVCERGSWREGGEKEKNRRKEEVSGKPRNSSAPIAPHTHQSGCRSKDVLRGRD